MNANHFHQEPTQYVKHNNVPKYNGYEVNKVGGLHSTQKFDIQFFFNLI